MPPGEKYFWLIGLRRAYAKRRLTFINDLGAALNPSHEKAKAYLQSLAHEAFYGDDEESLIQTLAAIYGAK